MGGCLVNFLQAGCQIAIEGKTVMEKEFQQQTIVPYPRHIGKSTRRRNSRQKGLKY
jgi:hypothetical protein